MTHDLIALDSVMVQLNEIDSLPMTNDAISKVWLFDLSAGFAEGFANSLTDGGLFLRGRDLSRWQSIGPADLARRFAINRIILLSLLAKTLGCSVSEVQIEISEKGKPLLGFQHRDQALSFSLSHTGDFLMVGLARNSVIGVDIEKIKSKTRAPDLVRRVFTPAEAQFVEAESGQAKTRRFVQLWSCKESIVKAIGSGMFEHMSSIELDISVGARPQIRSLPRSAGPLENWRIEFLYSDRIELSDFICTAASMANCGPEL